MAVHLFGTCRGKLPSANAGLRALIHPRLVSTVSQYPFPHHPRPTPHQIFHLSHGASQADIKSRYYELVREHHPDSAQAQHIPASERHSRFQAITAAYEALTGKSRLQLGSGFRSDSDMYEELRRRRRSHHRSAGMDFDHNHPFGFASGTSGREWTARPDERWKDWSIIFVGTACFIIGIAPIFFSHTSDKRHMSAVQNLAQARSEAQEYGMERRREIRRRVREYQLEQEERNARCSCDHKNERR
ncbi:hypothetical protein DEU56DRAFT_270648 [Suillus clintonianus]|uniref:uncharacterized protein n=1 Tax=Suillus clintonianus TaxID=1904413 RepID=UPI001B86233B|nr:uncharacterized protein DEU56DRAFT_270648 [Suillus clintonianus]KAG2141917.1 hypothetical protein DEU56DRAFT_270648 [Suillus clintonianus]